MLPTDILARSKEVFLRTKEPSEMSYSGDALTLVIFHIPLILNRLRGNVSPDLHIADLTLYRSRDISCTLNIILFRSSAALLSSSSLSDFRIQLPVHRHSLCKADRSRESYFPAFVKGGKIYPARRFTVKNCISLQRREFILLYPTFEGAISMLSYQRIERPLADQLPML